MTKVPSVGKLSDGASQSEDRYLSRPRQTALGWHRQRSRKQKGLPKQGVSNRKSSEPALRDQISRERAEPVFTLIVATRHDGKTSTTVIQCGGQ